MAFKSRNLFDPEKQFKISRSGVEQFLNCPRCFYLDKKIGLKQPQVFIKKIELVKKKYLFLKV